MLYFNCSISLRAARRVSLRADSTSIRTSGPSLGMCDSICLRCSSSRDAISPYNDDVNKDLLRESMCKCTWSWLICFLACDIDRRYTSSSAWTAETRLSAFYHEINAKSEISQIPNRFNLSECVVTSPKLQCIHFKFMLQFFNNLDLHGSIAY